MDRNELINSAAKLSPLTDNAATEYKEKCETLIGLINQKMLSRPDLDSLVGVNNKQMMKDNHANHARFMSSIMVNYDPNVMVDTVLWVFNAYQNHGFHSQYWSAQLNTWLEIYKEELSENTYKEVFPFYNWMQINIPQFVIVSKYIADLPNVGEH